ncbi:uncharacterized protein LOC113327496 [Papaver somniferum]|uniref:uncharacterized protein LOC113312047 n=1 Tax=Papaver somniferum TaxID=3469 RepID=UPI000E7048C3|nr:uncharacterized protein LOC113312047 [Papaver somniferum]XP_026430472.1 uncharacterized protein LOC113327496 [Papaver somniferum]
METHLHHLQLTLATLKEHSLFSKLSKCSFGQDQLGYLGHIISEEGVVADPTKIDNMTRWPTLVTIKYLRGFLGLNGYYRKFVRNYGIISKPITDLLKKNSFHWDSSAQTSFEKPKKVVTSTPVLVLPDFGKLFELSTDACDTGVGAVLM